MSSEFILRLGVNPQELQRTICLYSDCVLFLPLTPLWYVLHPSSFWWSPRLNSLLGNTQGKHQSLSTLKSLAWGESYAATAACESSPIHPCKPTCTASGQNPCPGLQGVFNSVSVPVKLISIDLNKCMGQVLTGTKLKAEPLFPQRVCKCHSYRNAEGTIKYDWQILYASASQKDWIITSRNLCLDSGNIASTMSEQDYQRIG